jgi:hypothetical protein
VTTIEEIITAIDQTIEMITEATGATAGAGAKTDRALTNATELGVAGPIEGLTAIRVALENLSSRLGAAGSGAQQARKTAQAVADNT